MSTIPIGFYAKTPLILATFAIDETNSGATIQELISEDITLTKDILIKNNSEEDLIIRVTGSVIPNNNILNLFGRSSIRLNTNSIRSIALSRTGSKSVSVSIYGR